MPRRQTLYEEIDGKMSGQLSRYLRARTERGQHAQDIAFDLHERYPDTYISIDTVRRWLRDVSTTG